MTTHPAAKILSLALCLLALWLAPLPAAPLSLTGEWRFALDRSAEQTDLNAPHPLPAGKSITEEWFKSDLPDRIQLPGILQAQGYGNEINPETPWVLGLGDAWWKLQPEELRAHFSQPGKVKVPFLSQPARHYLGVAWYQRDIEIPESWKGRRVELFLERPHWETTVWLDEKKIGSNKSLVAPHAYDLGLLSPGKHRLSIRIDNRRLMFNPAGDGHFVDSHSVSDALGATWNGIAGRIELRATSPVWIEDAQVFPDLAKKIALIKVRIGNTTGNAGGGRLSVGSLSAEARWTTAGGEAEITVPLSKDARTWDEFHPNLQHLTVSLTGDGADDSKALTFGLREISWRGKDMLLNGGSVNLRMTHSGGDFPLTGHPAMDVESWKKIIQTCKDYGLNGMRFHSWCPPEAAFEAADEMGFYLQPECGLWADFRSPEMRQWLVDETARLIAAYGNHPSFILLSPSNEPRNYLKFTPQWAAENYARDNRRLYAADSGWGDPAQLEGAQYAILARFRNGLDLRNTTGWFGNDFREPLEDVHIPMLAHEIGQWCAYPDFDVMKKFTGYLQPGNYEIFKYIAKQNGVLDENKDFAAASGRFQLECYKEEIEANLRTPGLAGYQMLDLHDYLGQGTALIGVLDAFWEKKGYVTPERFRKFNGPTVPLARLTKRTFTVTDDFACDAELYHFGDKPIISAKPCWKITDTTGRTVADGEWNARDIPIGKNIPLGKVTMDLSKLPAPATYKLVVGLKDTKIENDWNFWLYPAKPDAAVPDGVLETSNWGEAEKRLLAGGTVLFTPLQSDLDPSTCPPMKSVPIFWNIQMTVRPPKNPAPKFDAMLGLLCDPKHLALAQFPTEANCDWQWIPLIDDVRSVNLREMPRELKPIVSAIDDWNRNWRLGVIFECRVGKGRLLVSAIPPGDSPGSRQLRASLLHYAASEKFAPTVTIPLETIGKLWQRGASLDSSQPKRVFDPDLNDGTIPQITNP